MDGPITAGSAAGDAVSATLLQAVRAGGLRLPQGAKLLGRVLRVENYPEKQSTLVKFGFSVLESGASRYAFSGRLVGYRAAPGVLHGGRYPHSAAPEAGNTADFTLTGKAGQLPAGFRTRWRTAGPGR